MSPPAPQELLPEGCCGCYDVFWYKFWVSMGTDLRRNMRLLVRSFYTPQSASLLTNTVGLHVFATSRIVASRNDPHEILDVASAQHDLFILH
jgi:hypothetical protein